MAHDNDDSSDATAEDVRVGYQAAISLTVYEAGVFWSRFNTMLLANSLFIGIIGITQRGDDSVSIPSLMTPIAGVILCLVWFALMKRGIDYNQYWIASAKELENRLSPGAVSTVSRGEKFANGEKVDFEYGGSIHTMQMSNIIRKIKIQQLSLVVPFLFLLIYVCNIVSCREINWI